MNTARTLTIALGLVAMSSIQAAKAGYQFIGTRADFEAQTSALILIDFEDFGVGDDDILYFPSISRQGVTFDTPWVSNVDVAVSGKDWQWVGFADSAHYRQNAESMVYATIVTFDRAQTAVGLDIAAATNSKYNIDFGSEGLYVHTSLNSWDFAGFLLDNPVTSFSIRSDVYPGPSGSSGPVHIDNFTFVPEPATLSLLALGGLVVIRRKRRRLCGPSFSCEFTPSPTLAFVSGQRLWLAHTRPQ